MKLIKHNCPIEGEMMIESGKPCNWCNILDTIKVKSKQYIITQEELDMLEAIRLDIYNTYVANDDINAIIVASNVTRPLWKLINKKREIINEP